MPAEDPRLETQFRRITHPGTLEVERARGRPHCPRLIPVPIRDRLLRPLVPPTAEKLAHLVFQRPLQNQPRTKPADRLHRVLILADTGQRFIEL